MRDVLVLFAALVAYDVAKGAVVLCRSGLAWAVARRLRRRAHAARPSIRQADVERVAKAARAPKGGAAA